MKGTAAKDATGIGTILALVREDGGLKIVYSYPERT